jgi:hypothetical protein
MLIRIHLKQNRICVGTQIAFVFELVAIEMKRREINS